uniref:Wzy n=1 Tax=Streptococcus suis TaxID=1307 RepID=A0A0F6UYR1_STRSU|nr:Wzy [Streptococcus suis]AKE80505.1 Wzy [Streptococcus suis]AKE80526.1 Wzy [Streptococcus suis]AKE80547.1 Wzy [Streptococcus suis]
MGRVFAENQMIESRKIKVSTLEFYLNIMAIVLILVSEINFYTPESIKVYSVLTMIGMVISYSLGVQYFRYRVRLNHFIIWISVIYFMFCVYGIFFLRSGVFPIDSILYRYFENIALYLSISSILRKNYIKITLPFVLAGLFSIIYLISKEGADIISGGVRIGGSLSGNVNSVGFNFGLVSSLLAWRYCITKNKHDMILFLVFVIFMLLTGSKKTLFFLLTNLFIFYYHNRHKAIIWLKVILSFFFLWILIFKIPYFYSIMGFRIEQMLMTLLGDSNTLTYSYSTDMREKMLVESLHFFLEHPIFGGGWNYFGLKTTLNYDYSHSNIAELSVTFGLMGLFTYYARYIYNIYISLNGLRDLANKKKNNFSLLSFSLVSTILFIEWSAVTFSAQVFWYLPIIISCAMLNEILQKSESK